LGFKKRAYPGFLKIFYRYPKVKGRKGVLINHLGRLENNAIKNAWTRFSKTMVLKEK